VIDSLCMCVWLTHMNRTEEIQGVRMAIAARAHTYAVVGDLAARGNGSH